MTRKMKRAALALAAALLCGALSGCGAEEPAVTETFAMDTGRRLPRVRQKRPGGGGRGGPGGPASGGPAGPDRRRQ